MADADAEDAEADADASGESGRGARSAATTLRLLLMLVSVALAAAASAHEGTRPEAGSVHFASSEPQAETSRPTGLLVLHPVDAATGEDVAADVRVTSLESGEAVPLAELHGRPEGWRSQARPTPLRLPPGRYRVESFQGLRTELKSAEVVVSAGDETSIELPLVAFEARGDWFDGNTHLHIKGIPLDQAKDYLQVVSAADGLDFVWVSHLEREGFDQAYVSNALDPDSTHALDTAASRFGWGEELRHNFEPTPAINGYGHVLLLDIPELVEPVSLGPVLTGSGTDGTPLRPGIEQARSAGGTVLWAHNQRGFEDIPGWIDGVLDGQNVWDGGQTLELDGSMYRYLDVGLRVPLASGTDWWIASLSRVRVQLEAPAPGVRPTREGFLAALRAGHTTVTTGPLLDFEVDGVGPGGTVELAAAGAVQATARAAGRVRFDALEVVLNGQIVARAAPKPVAGHWEARIASEVDVAESSWLAARVPESEERTELGGPRMAHSSAVVVEVAGVPRFDRAVARDLVSQMDWERRDILTRGKFSSAADAARVTRVYDDAIAHLEARLPLLDRARTRLIRLLRSLRDWLYALFR